MRLHLALLSVVAGTPVVALAYDEKVTQQGLRHQFPTLPLDEHFGAASVIGLVRTLQGGSAAAV